MLLVDIKFGILFFNKTVIDAFMNVTVSFDGYNTEGEAHVENAGIDYDMTNEDLAQFVGDISFEVKIMERFLMVIK